MYRMGYANNFLVITETRKELVYSRAIFIA